MAICATKQPELAQGPLPVSQLGLARPSRGHAMENAPTAAAQLLAELEGWLEDRRIYEAAARWGIRRNSNGRPRPRGELPGNDYDDPSLVFRRFYGAALGLSDCSPELLAGLPIRDEPLLSLQSLQARLQRVVADQAKSGDVLPIASPTEMLPTPRNSPGVSGTESDRPLAAAGSHLEFELGDRDLRRPRIGATETSRLTPSQYDIIKALYDAHPERLSSDELYVRTKISKPVDMIDRIRASHHLWATVLGKPGKSHGGGYGLLIKKVGK
ncbi:MAG: hypothetical protein P4L84_33015 [Isosphaeraceae bacterium]|nr:hypothetical protein [Isosphaeraceae bacterium]